MQLGHAAAAGGGSARVAGPGGPPKRWRHREGQYACEPEYRARAAQTVNIIMVYRDGTQLVWLMHFADEVGKKSERAPFASTIPLHQLQAAPPPPAPTAPDPRSCPAALPPEWRRGHIHASENVSMTLRMREGTIMLRFFGFLGIALVPSFFSAAAARKGEARLARQRRSERAARPARDAR